MSLDKETAEKLAEHLLTLTECDVYMTDEGPRIWCEVDLAGPCKGCPEDSENGSWQEELLEALKTDLRSQEDMKPDAS